MAAFSHDLVFACCGVVRLIAPRRSSAAWASHQARTESVRPCGTGVRFHGPATDRCVDLAMRTADPGDSLALLDGRLAERIPAPEDEKSAGAPRSPDGSDGRLHQRVRYTTPDPRSKPSLIRHRYDLRSFSASNAGAPELQLVGRLTNDIVFAATR